MTGERHEIVTYADMLRATKAENVEAFIVDIGNALRQWTAMRLVIEAVQPETLEATINSAKFTWIDDGKHEMTLNIGVLGSGESK